MDQAPPGLCELVNGRAPRPPRDSWHQWSDTCWTPWTWVRFRGSPLLPGRQTAARAWPRRHQTSGPWTLQIAARCGHCLVKMVPPAESARLGWLRGCPGATRVAVRLVSHAAHPAHASIGVPTTASCCIAKGHVDDERVGSACCHKGDHWGQGCIGRITARCLHLGVARVANNAYQACFFTQGLLANWLRCRDVKNLLVHVPPRRTIAPAPSPFTKTAAERH